MLVNIFRQESWIENVVVDEMFVDDMQPGLADDEIPEDPILADAWITVMADLEATIRDELRQRGDELQLEAEVSLDEEALASAAADRVPCPVCCRHALAQSGPVIYCACGLRINTQVRRAFTVHSLCGRVVSGADLCAAA